MRTTIKFILPIVLGLALFFSCDLLGDEGTGSIKDIGGDTNFMQNQVGSTMEGRVKIDGSSISSDAKLEVINNDNGIITLRATGTLPSQYRSLIPDKYVDSQGRVDIDFKVKNSTTGIAYVNPKGKQSVLVKFDQKKGDSWTYKTKKGKVFKRKVIHKSTTDDFQYLFKIKVIAVEQNLPYPGFSKIIYRANHKFGMVQAEVHLDDGTKVEVMGI